MGNGNIACMHFIKEARQWAHNGPGREVSINFLPDNTCTIVLSTTVDGQIFFGVAEGWDFLNVFDRAHVDLYSSVARSTSESVVRRLLPTC